MIYRALSSFLLLTTCCATAFGGNPQTVSPNQANSTDSTIQNGVGSVENQLISDVKNKYEYYQANLPPWLQRIDFNVYMQEYTKPIWYIRTIQPIHQTKNNVFFTQDQVSYQNEDSQKTSNLGLGYRHLLKNKKWIVGVNSFYDREWHFKHQRVGVGLEAMGQYATFRGNYYDAFSDRKLTSTVNGVSYYEEALDGLDATAELPIPFLPWARVAYTRYYWWRHVSSNINGYQFTLNVTPTSNIETSLGITDDNASRKTYFMNLSWHFGRPARVEFAWTTEPYSARAFTPRNLDRHMLDYVKRENRIIVEKTQSSGSNGIIIARGN